MAFPGRRILETDGLEGHGTYESDISLPKDSCRDIASSVIALPSDLGETWLFSFDEQSWVVHEFNSK
jgi:hypothetical protein